MTTSKLSLLTSGALIVVIASLLIVFFTYPPFFEWAFERHQNTLSWAARPILVLPYAFFAWKRSMNGILLTILAMFSSMFWFPIPEVVNPQVAEFLAMEKERLQAGFDRQNLISIVAIIAYGWGVAAALWKRSLLLGGIVAISGAIVKVGWSILSSPESGIAVLPFATGGALALVLIFWVIQIRRRKSGS